ncbi:MAG: phosphatidylcholine synthase, partial [Notoacmeibacter sp.]
AIIVITSAIYYADTGMKTKENFFRGFPVVWNMAVFVLFALSPGEWLSFALVIIMAVTTFLPINFLHPVRVVRLRMINLPMTLVWCLLGAICLMTNMEPPMIVKILFALASIYLFVIGGIMQLFPKLGATH